MKKTVLLLGANGQLGALIAASPPENVTLFTKSSAELDITNGVKLSELLEEVQPDVIINAAAYTQVDKAEEEIEKAYAVNASGPKNIAEAMNKKTRLIHISTDFVFSGSSLSPYLPTDKTEPLSIYGKSKLAGEEHLLELKPKQTCIIRTSWLYSAEGKNFVNTMLALMKSREQLSIVSDQIGTPTSAHTLAKVIWDFVEKGVPEGVFHWSDKGETNWYEFACAIQQEALGLALLDKQISLEPIATEDYPVPAKRPAYSVLDKTNTYRALGYEGQPWQKELQETLQRIKR